MAYAQKDERVITLDDCYTIRVWWENTRYGFRHLAVLSRDYGEVARTKCCYYNRTWERYQYQSVLYKLVDKHFSDEDAERYKEIVDGGGAEKSVGVERDLAPFRTMGLLGKLAGLMATDKEQEVALKKKTLKAMPGIELPDDFDSLPVDTQLERIDKVLELAAK